MKKLVNEQKETEDQDVIIEKQEKIDRYIIEIHKRLINYSSFQTIKN